MSRTLLLILATSILMPASFAHDASRDMTDAANAWLGSLSDSQRAKAEFDLTGEERENWHFIPRDRNGLSIKEMSAEQRTLAHALLTISLSETGYAKATNIMSLEAVLAVIENRPEHRDPEKYYFSIFGAPAADKPWGWRVEGHHLSFNFTIPGNDHAPSVTRSEEGRGERDELLITLGTGVGGGLILNGELYHGASDVAGEIGHTTIDSTGRRCKCGNYGCLEAYASGPAIAERAREMLQDYSGSSMVELAGGDPVNISAQTVYDAATRGDPIAREVVRDTARLMGAGIANLLNIFNPDVVVVMGGVTHAGNTLMDPLRAEVRRRAFPPAVSACRIVLGELTGTAGVVGAVATFKAQHSRPL
jgi:hypothetical protein